MKFLSGGLPIVLIVGFFCQCSSLPQQTEELTNQTRNQKTNQDNLQNEKQEIKDQKQIIDKNETEKRPIDNRIQNNKTEEINKLDEKRSKDDSTIAAVIDTDSEILKPDDDDQKKDNINKIDDNLLEQERLDNEKRKAEQQRQEELKTATELKRVDANQEREAAIAKQRFLELLPIWKNDAAKLMNEDELEEADFLITKQKFETAAKIEAEYRNRRIDKADPERHAFYRVDSEVIFPDRFSITDVVTRHIRLFRNRKPQQFIGYDSKQKYKPAIDLIPIATEPARRLRLYDFFKGRIGNYVLLNELNEPITINEGSRSFKIVNIRSDGDVLIIVDLESDSLQQYHRVSVADIILVME